MASERALVYAVASSIEERMARMAGAYEQISHRLERLEQGLSELRGDMRTQFYWLLGLLLPMWLTIILTVALKS